VATSSFKLTKRGFVLIGVGLFILVTLAVPLRGLLREQRDVAQLRQAVVEQKQTIKDLTNRRERLKDPAYLQSLARARLNYVFPNETGYVVLDKETSTEVSTVPGALVPNDDSPWYTKLWKSTKLADKKRDADNPLVVPTTDK
jgi:cell division protein FtsB